MSKKTSPNSRPARRPLRPRLGNAPGTAETSVDKRPTTFAGKLRRFAPRVAVADALIVVAVIVLALAGVMLSGSPLSMLPTAIAELWMISHMAPVKFEGVTVSVLPMLPALGVVAVVASRVRAIVRRKVSVFDLAVIVGVVLAVPVLLTVIAWLMLLDAGNVYPVSAPPLLDALIPTALIHFMAFVIGVGVKLWRAICKRYRVPVEVVNGARTGATFLGYLALAAVVVLFVIGLFGLERQQEMLAAYPDHDAAMLAGLVFLTVMYLPNAAVAMMSVLLGGDVTFGDASVSLFSIHLVPLPPLPLTAVVPGAAHPVAPALLLVTALVASYVWVSAKPRLLHVAGGSLVAGLVMAVLVFLISGELGWYGHVGPTWWIAPALVVVWLAATGLGTVAALALSARRHRAETAPAPPAETDAVQDAVDGPEEEAGAGAGGDVADADVAGGGDAGDDEAGAGEEGAGEEGAVEKGAAAPEAPEDPGEGPERDADPEAVYTTAGEDAEETGAEDHTEAGGTPGGVETAASSSAGNVDGGGRGDGESQESSSRGDSDYDEPGDEPSEDPR